MEVNKKAKVIVLPTEDKTDIVRNTYCFTEAHGNPLRYVPNMENKNNLIERGYEYQHLYITTDDEIKEGDWFIINGGHFIKNGIRKCYYRHESPQSIRGKVKLMIQPAKTKGGGFCYPEEVKKIIATTNKSLVIGREHDDTVPFPKMRDKRLPKPSQAFIKKYCEVGGIDEVLVEYEEKCPRCKCDNYDECWSAKECSVNDSQYIQTLKVNSHNEITIHPIKTSWSREELQFLKGSSGNHLKFIYERMAFKHKENVNYDYMLKLKEIVHWVEDNL